MKLNPSHSRGIISKHVWLYLIFSVSAGRPPESVDVHGLLLLSLLHSGQSLHWTAQVHSRKNYMRLTEKRVMSDLLNKISVKQNKWESFTTYCLHTSVTTFGVSLGFMRLTACWHHLTTQHNHHGRTPNTWVSSSGCNVTKYIYTYLSKTLWCL